MGFRFTIRRLPAILGVALTLSGCASWKVDKTLQSDPEDVKRLTESITQVRRFQAAVYDVSTFAVDRCTRTTLREPFALITIGQIANHYTPEQAVTYWHAAGWDETWKVLWSHPDSPIKEGERVLKINNTTIENNKTGLGELPLGKYLISNYRARRAAEAGKPYTVTMEDGRNIEVELKPACRVQVWTIPPLELESVSVLPATKYDAVIIPSTAIHVAANVDEHRYLAGLAMYFGAGAEMTTKRVAGDALVTLSAGASAAVGIMAVQLFPWVYGVVSPLAIGLQRAMMGSADLMKASIFATQIVSDMGGDPYAGLNLMHRLDQMELGAYRVMLESEDRQLLHKLIDESIAATFGATPIDAAMTP